MSRSNKISKVITLSVVFLMVIAFVYACGSEEDEQFSGNSLQISLTCPDPTTLAELSRTGGIDRSLNDIVTLLLTVEGGSPPLSQISDIFDPDDELITIDVPVGSDRIFTITGLDIAGNVICAGETTTDINFDIVNIDIPCDLVIEDCFDGIDNDFDDLIDCEDIEDCDDTCMEPVEPPEPVPPGSCTF